MTPLKPSFTMPTPSSFLKTLTLIALCASTLTTALPAQDAHACSYIEAYGIDKLIPAEAASGVPIDAPIAFMATSDISNSLGGKTFFPGQVTIEVTEKASGAQVPGELGVFQNDSIAFTPNSALSPNTEYEASIREDASLLHSWSFTTGSDTRAPAPSSFDASTSVSVKEVLQKSYSSCQDLSSSCGSEDPKRVHSGWNVNTEATITFNALPSSAQEAHYYSYRIYERGPVDGDTIYLSKQLPSEGQSSFSITVPVYENGSSHCFKVVASSVDVLDAEIESTEGFVCATSEPRNFEIPEDPDISGFECPDGTRLVGPDGDVAADSWICGNSTTDSTPAGPLSTLLMVLAGMVGLRVRRRQSGC